MTVIFCDKCQRGYSVAFDQKNEVPCPYCAQRQLKRLKEMEAMRECQSLKDWNIPGQP